MVDVPETVDEITAGVVEGLRTEGVLSDSEAEQWLDRVESADGELSEFVVMNELYEEYREEIEQISDRLDDNPLK